MPFYFGTQIAGAAVFAAFLQGCMRYAALSAMVCMLLLAAFWMFFPASRLRALFVDADSPQDTEIDGDEFLGAADCANCAERLHCRRKNAVDYGPFWRSIRLVNSLMALCWGVLAIYWLCHPDDAAFVSATGAFVVFFLASLPMALVSRALTYGACVIVVCVGFGLLFSPGDAQIRLFVSVLVLATAGGFNVLGHGLFRQLTHLLLDVLHRKEQAEITSLLMRHSDSELGEWIWRTDGAGRIQNPSTQFADMLGGSVADIQGVSLATVLGLPAIGLQQGAPAERLMRCLENRLAFRDICIPVMRNGVRRWWTLTGRPVFVNGKFLGHRGVGADFTRRYDMNQRISHGENHDDETGLPNRLGFSAIMHDALVAMTADSRPFALILIGVAQERAESDRAIHDLAICLHDVVETQYRLCRYNAGELLLLCQAPPGATSAAGVARDTVQKLCKITTDFRAAEDLRVGVVLAPEAGGQMSQLLNAVSEALADARKGPRDAVCFFDHAVTSRAAAQETMLTQVRDAVRDRAFELFYQPILDTRTLQVCGAEALTRWNGGAAGRMPIDRVIRIIEADNMGEEFDLWVLETACRAVIHWPEKLWVSVNMGAALFTDPSLPKTVAAILRRTGVPASRLQIEVTETLFLAPRTEVFSTLAALNRLGVRIAVDDFGTGFSSLEYLRLFPFSKLKLDGSFVQEMLHDSRSAAVVRSVLELAVDLGIPVVAEAVSSEEQYLFLRDSGCPQVQGYFLGRPMPEGEFLEYLSENRPAKNGNGMLDAGRERR